jgi:hypothetical protein
MKRSKRKMAPQTKAKAAPDSMLIASCVEFAQSVAAYRGGFKADPDSHCRYADSIGDPFLKRAQDALFRAGKLSPEGPKGLDAKARIVPIVLGEEMWQEETQAFIEKFANDVRQMLRSMGARHVVESSLIEAETTVSP